MRRIIKIVAQFQMYLPDSGPTSYTYYDNALIVKHVLTGLFLGYFFDLVQ